MAILFLGRRVQTILFFVRKGKTRVGGSVNHGIKNSLPNIEFGIVDLEHAEFCLESLIHDIS